MVFSPGNLFTNVTKLLYPFSKIVSNLALNIEDRQKLDHPQKIITWIHPRETITKQDYNTQVGRQTEFVLPKGGHKTIIVSLGDAIQILSILQTDQEKGRLIRKLIIKIEKL